MLPQEGSSPVSNSTDVHSEVSDERESFQELLSAFERTHSTRTEPGQQIQGTVVAISADSVIVDVGFKSEGVLPLELFADAKEAVAVGDRLPVSVKGRNAEGYYELSRLRVEQPKDWQAMEQAMSEKAVVVGTVTAEVKGGLTVDIGVRAFLPASRSGVKDSAEMESLVGQEIRCRITKVDEADEDVVVDRRGVLEEEERATKEQRYSEVKVGDVAEGTVRSLASYGAFVDLGGLDGLLHIGEISWARVEKVEDVLEVGQSIRVKVIKIEPESRRISLSVKQLQPHPWEGVSAKYKVGDRVRGTVTRLADFGAFAELEPGVEGMIHISEMSWGKKVRKPGDMLKVGDAVEVVILAINAEEHRLSLGLKQALGDPWADLATRMPVGSVAEGEVASFTKFGAFVLLPEGIQGLVHISEITGERRLNHPQDALRLGQKIQAKVLEVDAERRQLRLSIKQMAPTGLEDFLAEHHVGDVVTGRIVELQGGEARVELGEAVLAVCVVPEARPAEAEPAKATGAVDLSALGSMLKAQWKGGNGGVAAAAAPKPQAVAPGQIRRFRIAELPPGGGEIRLTLEG